MFINCPNCDTQFSVPDHALGAEGRKLKCAKCGHKWFQEPPGAEPPAPLAMESVAVPTTAGKDDIRHSDIPRGDAGSIPLSSPPRDDEEANGGGGGGLDLDEDGPPLDDLDKKASGTKDARTDKSQPDFSSLLDEPGPIPDMFSSPVAGKEAKKRGGGAGLWLVLALLLGSAGGGVYYYQDEVIHHVPQVEPILEKLGLRNDAFWAGLELRHPNSVWVVDDGTDVLIVRGVIANVTDRMIEVPMLKLELKDEANPQRVVQEKIAAPPVTALAGGQTVGFRIVLERPHPYAKQVEVTFTTPEAEARGE